MRASLKFARHVATRLLASVPAIIGVVVLTFLVMRVLPGDPLETRDGRLRVTLPGHDFRWSRWPR